MTRKKLGHRKILGACNQASSDGLNFIWIDSCCINQSNHAEVARNINSMYSYYGKAEVCYAYLADVHNPKYGATYGCIEWLDSRWFQRGWTLQELLAPRQVVFFNGEWELIGDKHQKKFDISRRTGIPASVLEGNRSVEDVDIAERMTWCAGRQTTKPPDLAYCLLGILGVTMTPDYTEDVGMAFKRLQNILIRSYPNCLSDFQSGDIYSTLLRQNARARIGAGNNDSRDDGNGVSNHNTSRGINSYASHGVPNNRSSSIINPDFRHFITSTSSADLVRSNRFKQNVPSHP
jgi:hypothetical protein